MRIIAGLAKGRKLITPKGYDVRPTTDRVKEAIFSMISSYISGAIVLDLFSGTGNLGLEAISRGAEKVYFVDKNSNSIRITTENINMLDVQGSANIFNNDAISALENFACQGIKFDIIFMDPPYGKGILKPCLEIIDKKRLLNEEGLIIVEHNKLETIDFIIGNITMLRNKKYGNTIISIYTTGKED